MKRMIVAMSVCVLAIVSMTIFGCGGDDDPTGTGQIHGNVESFENMAVVARLMGAVQGVIVHLDGPVSRTTITDPDGGFSFVDLPPGQYTLSFEYNGEEVTYRGNSGQEATITVEDNQRVEATNITVSGGHVNIGNITVVQLDGPVDPADTETNDTGTVTNEVPEDPEPEPDPEPAQDTLTNGLVLHYTFDSNDGGTVIDQSGNGNNGTVNGPTWTSAGVIGGGLSFNGNGDYVDTADSSSLDVRGAVTISAWVKPTLATHHRIVCKWGSDGYRSYNMDIETDGSPTFHISYNGINSPCAATSAGQVIASTWHHVLMIYSRGEPLRIYVDGQKKSVETFGVPIQDAPIYVSATPLRLGRNYNDAPAGNYFGGTLDEVRVYNRALTATEITGLYNRR